jgi:hypothetical protein
VRALLLAAACTYAYFVGAPAWNQNSRFALTQSLVDDRSPVIDRFAATTGDKSQRDGHFYSDKSPGTSLLAVPAYAMYSGVRHLTGGEAPAIEIVPLDPDEAALGRAPPPGARAAGDRLHYNVAFRVALYVARVGSVSLLAVAGLAAFFLIALELARARAPNPSPRARRIALASTAVYGLATPAFVYATSLYGHRPAADALVVAFAIAWLAPKARSPSPAAGAALGTALGWAVLFEYTAAIPIAILTAWSIPRLGRQAAATMLAAGLFWALVLAAYHTWSFGGPFQTGYDHLVDPEFAEGMEVRYGLGAPNAEIALHLLFGSYRGLFFVSPVLLMAAWGLWLVRPTGVALICAALVVYYVALVSGYYMWDGGAATGPRHMLPAVPFLALGLVEAFRLAPRATAALSAISGVIMLAAADAGPEAPQHGVAIWEHAWVQLGRSGRAATADASNLGRFAGLPGPISLVPLIAAWIAAFAFFEPNPAAAPDR